MNFLYHLFILIVLTVTNESPYYAQGQNRVKSLSVASQDLLVALKERDMEKTEKIVTLLANTDRSVLLQEISDDEHKKAFWTNIYNAFVVYRLLKNPSEYDDRGKFFKTESIEIADQILSLDNIEHDILRRRKHKLSKGYFNKLCTSKEIKELMVDRIDYRIHFALNCGAYSCPPIRIYTPENIEKEFASASKDYLTAEVEYFPEKNMVRVPVLMDWFMGDFDGVSGTRKILHDLDLIEPGSKPKVRYKSYNWDLKVGI